MTNILVGLAIAVLIAVPFIISTKKKLRQSIKAFDELTVTHTELVDKHETLVAEQETKDAELVEVKAEQAQVKSDHDMYMKQYKLMEREKDVTERESAAMQNNYDKLYQQFDVYREELYLSSRDEGWREFALATERIRDHQEAENRGMSKFFKAIDSWDEFTPDEFLEKRQNNIQGTDFANEAGIYIIHNKTNDAYYVGQGADVLNGAHNHFMGRGNGDIYADHKYGHVFTIKIVTLEGSGYDTLDEFEQDGIDFYQSIQNGYNTLHDIESKQAQA